MTRLIHTDEPGRVRTVDASDDVDTVRTSFAVADLVCARETLDAVRDGRAPSGCDITTAELAGAIGARRNAELIPMCHPLTLDKVAVTVKPDDAIPGFRVTAEVRATGATGVEMEALAATSITCLTLYDMLKSIDCGIRVANLRVLSKTGEKPGDWSEG